MPQYCVCGGCTNSCTKGHRVHLFPNRVKNGVSFRAWVRFVQVKRRDFTSASVSKNAVLCDAHFREDDYDPGDLMAWRMGFRNRDRVRLKPSAVPTIHAPAKAPSPAAAAACSPAQPKRSRKSTTGVKPAEKPTSPSVMSGNSNWDAAGGMDGITVVKIDDSHIAEEQSHVRTKGRDGAAAYHDMAYALPEEEGVGEEEEDGVYVIEYSNPEEEGESYQFTMSVDRSLPVKKPTMTTLPSIRENARAPLPVTQAAPKLQRPQRSRTEPKRRLIEEDEVKKEEILSNKCVLELGEDYSEVLRHDGKSLVCSLCPPPGRFFKRASGLAIHLKQMHYMEGKKTFFCVWCKQNVRSQVELDSHTKRHANQDAVYTCYLCASQTGNKPERERRSFEGSRWALKNHMKKEHPGVVPDCHICHKKFKLLTSYLADQFRHVGVTPYHCARCQIYEITERGLSVHIKNHDKPKKTKLELGGKKQTLTEAVVADNSATDDSDF